MILGIGIDATEISRFEGYQSLSEEKLLKIFHPNEITYCKREPQKSAERFAARFAVKEALYKALCQMNGGAPCSFLQICKHSEIKNTPAPSVSVAWEKIGMPPHEVLASITHTQKIALAQVVVQKI